MNLVEIDGENEIEISDPLTVISGSIRSSKPIHIQLIAEGEKCYVRTNSFKKIASNPAEYIYGFSSVLFVLKRPKQDSIRVAILDSEETIYEVDLPVSSEFSQNIAALSETREEIQLWLQQNLKCPNCDSEEALIIDSENSNITCDNCGSSYDQNKTNALYMMRPDMAEEYSHDFPADASWHEFSENLVKKIKEVTDRGGKVLDFGGGLKTQRLDGVVSLELIDYPHVDLIASGDRIPLKDEVFDLVLSISVFEHVKDPFSCAKEISRVTKKGGSIFCVVPFMFPVHAHPNHYYNMTAQGVQNLFGDTAQAEKVEYGHPIRVLRQVANIYYNSLPRNSASRQKFTSLTIQDLLDTPKKVMESEDYCTELSDAEKEVIAHGTRTWLTKC